MPIIREFICANHGVFRSASERPLCQHDGCDLTPERYFESAPSIRTTPAMKNKDRIVEGMMQNLGLTDISNSKGTVAETMKLAPTPAPVSSSPKDDIASGRLDGRSPFYINDKARKGIAVAPSTAQELKARGMNPLSSMTKVVGGV